ncbi:hypothetical protein GGR56DRAFT_423899 [Xylariaceae sp. FL0804]|nr:hypothetical protein GGR56DRAFT_423899 [Xylariaceae sp. FL0804]
MLPSDRMPNKANAAVESCLSLDLHRLPRQFAVSIVSHGLQKEVIKCAGKSSGCSISARLVDFYSCFCSSCRFCVLLFSHLVMARSFFVPLFHLRRPLALCSQALSSLRCQFIRTSPCTLSFRSARNQKKPGCPVCFFVKYKCFKDSATEVARDRGISPTRGPNQNADRGIMGVKRRSMPENRSGRGTRGGAGQTLATRKYIISADNAP